MAISDDKCQCDHVQINHDYDMNAYPPLSY